MMSREQVMELLESAGADLLVDVRSDGEIVVVVQDFEGFDDDWDEVDRELDDPDRVEEIEEVLEHEALSASGDFYRYYQFDGFSVCWGYASFEI